MTFAFTAEVLSGFRIYAIGLGVNLMYTCNGIQPLK